MLSTSTTTVIFIFMTLIMSTLVAVHRENKRIEMIQSSL